MLQIGAVAVLAASVHGAVGPRPAEFALSYVAVRAVLVVEYLRAGCHVPKARPLTRHYAGGFSAAAALWLLSLLVPPPGRFVRWAAAMSPAGPGGPPTADPLVQQGPTAASSRPELGPSSAGSEARALPISSSDRPTR